MRAICRKSSKQNRTELTELSEEYNMSSMIDGITKNNYQL